MRPSVQSPLEDGHEIAPLDIVGVATMPLGWHDAIALLRDALRQKRFTRVGFLNAHVANVSCSDPAVANALREFLILPDGVGVDMAARFLYGRNFPANLNGTDFVPAFLASEGAPLTVGLIGARRSNAEGAIRALAHQAPNNRYVLVRDGFFSADDEAGILADLKALKPDVLLVAMGVPRQEFWIAERLTPEHCTIAFGVGALFDFLSGAAPRAPLGVRKARLEWLFRLWIEPGRLWRRYIIGNPLFLWRVLRQRLGAPFRNRAREGRA